MLGLNMRYCKQASSHAAVEKSKDICQWYAEKEVGNKRFCSVLSLSSLEMTAVSGGTFIICLNE